MATWPPSTQKYYITNAAAPNCVLDVYGNNRDQHGKVGLYTKNNGQNQQWTFDNGYITNVASGLVLQIELDANETIRSGALVTQGTQKGSGNNHNQLWILNVHTDHAYIMPWDPRAADVVLAGQNNESSSGTLASVQTVDPTLVAQQWTTSFADSG